MKSKEDIKVAIADGSVIMRSGLASVLKHFSEFNFRINEITNQEALTIFLRLHTPDLLIINPLFAIGMNLATIRKTYPSLKIAASTTSCCLTTTQQFLLMMTSKRFAVKSKKQSMSLTKNLPNKMP